MNKQEAYKILDGAEVLPLNRDSTEFITAINIAYTSLNKEIAFDKKGITLPSPNEFLEMKKNIIDLEKEASEWKEKVKLAIDDMKSISTNNICHFCIHGEEKVNNLSCPYEKTSYNCFIWNKLKEGKEGKDENK